MNMIRWEMFYEIWRRMDLAQDCPQWRLLVLGLWTFCFSLKAITRF